MSMMETEQVQRIIEAILMAAEEPLPLAKLKSILAHDECIDVEQLSEVLQQRLLLLYKAQQKILQEV